MSRRFRRVSDWWRDAVCYQIYPRSYGDTNGDGIGDLRGITAHLGHLEWLGIDAIWLSPTFPSPNDDWGYDVSDYYGVHPDLGTMDDLDELIAQAENRGIRVLLDLVPNHTSQEHPWFLDARTSRDARYRDWFVWADPKPDGSAPNNWVSTFMGPAWELDERTGQYYLHNFLVQQPDLNWWNPEVTEEFDRILRFWFDRGVAGFRVDVAHMIIKDKELRDNPPAGPDDPLIAQFRGQLPVYNSNRPEVHNVHKHWRSIGDSYDPPRMFVGETFVDEVSEMVSYYGNGDEENLAFNIPFLHTEFLAGPLRALVDETERLVPKNCAQVWTGSNHDVSRFPTRWANNNDAAARCALLMLLTLRGSAFLYYGDELGMPDTSLTKEQLVDPVSINLYPVHNRDAARTPMQWTADPGAGFTEAGAEPWIPFGDFRGWNVAAQHDDPKSFLHLTRDVIALRRESPDLRTGAYAVHAGDDSIWAWRRGDRVLVAINLSDETRAVDDVQGEVAISTDRALDHEHVDGRLSLAPWQGAIVVLS